MSPCISTSRLVKLMATHGFTKTASRQLSADEWQYEFQDTELPWHYMFITADYSSAEGTVICRVTQVLELTQAGLFDHSKLLRTKPVHALLNAVL